MTDAMPLLPPDTPVLDTLGGCRVLTLMAAELEYGPMLSQRVRAVRIGVGPVEAAVNTACALAALQRGGALPELVVSIGSAGSARLAQTSVHRVASVSWRDIDASPLGIDKGLTPFLDLPAERALPTLPGVLPSLPAARLSTGADVVPNAARYAAIDADMVDMETFAVLRACEAFGVPLLGIRAISDGAADLQRFGDWADCLPLLDRGLADAVAALDESLSPAALDAAG